MNKSFLRLLSIVASGLAVAPVIAEPTTAPSMAATPSTAPSAAAPDMVQVKPDMQALQSFLKQVRPPAMQLQPIDGDKSAWSDPAKREKLTSDAQGPLKDILPMLQDMAKQGKSREVEMVGGDTFLTTAAVFGDADVQKQVTEMAAKSDAQGRWARVGIAASKFYLANGDAAGQAKALDALEGVYTADSAAKSSVARAEVSIYEGKPSTAIADRIDTFVTKTLKVPAITQMKAEQTADANRDALVGKPMVISGLLKDGTQFSTANMKGKVILVDFWATWCGPCKVELPRVKKEYADMHDKGLEVIGVSFDQTSAALDKFLAANPDMPWPQLFDPQHPFWKNQLGEKYFIHGIPTMFLIDKSGVCRSVTAREDFEKIIPDLLAEKSAI